MRVTPNVAVALLVSLAVTQVQCQQSNTEAARSPRAGSGEGPPTKAPEAPDSESREFNSQACAMLPPIPGDVPSFPRYNFTFKNRVLPEHCEMIYYGSCRNSLQCQICDDNRVVGGPNPASAYQTPGKTFCQKVNEREGRCVPCSSCSICTTVNGRDFRATWETHEAATDCRVPSVCPDALDEIEDGLNSVVDDYEKRIAELEVGGTGSAQEQSDLAALRLQLEQELQDERDEYSVMKDELDRLKAEKNKITAWVLTNNQKCENDASTCSNMTYDEMVMQLETERLAALIGNDTQKAHYQKSIDALSDIFDDSGEVTVEMAELSMEMKNVSQADDISKLLDIIQSLQAEKGSTTETSSSLEAVAAVSITLFVGAFCAVLYFMFKRNQLTPQQLETRKESGKSLIEEDQNPFDDAAGSPTAKKHSMRAWDNYDEDEGQRLSEGDMINPKRPATDGYAMDELDGQMGYVTSDQQIVINPARSTGASRTINVSSFKTNTTV